MAQQTFADLVIELLGDKVILGDQNLDFNQTSNSKTIKRVQEDKSSLKFKESIDMFMQAYLGSVNSYYALIFKFDEGQFNCDIDTFIKSLNAEGAIEFDKPGSTCPLNRLELFKNPSYMFPKYKNIFKNKEIFLSADKF